MKLKRYWPIAAAAFAVVLSLVLLRPSREETPVPRPAPVPMETKEVSRTIEAVPAASVVEASTVPRAHAPARKAKIRPVAAAPRKTPDTTTAAATAAPRASSERWCGGAYEPARGTNFGGCP